MGAPDADRPDTPPGHEMVVVPHTPGPVLALDAERRRRDRDDLDEVIDELLPDVEERPGWFDAGLVIVGAGLLAWAVFGGAPTVVAVLGVVALGLGVILPIRAAWRRASQRQERRRRDALLTKGVPIVVSSPAPARLVKAYEDLARLVDASDAGRAALAAAHVALLESASLLHGRAPASEREREYVEKRAVAVEGLAAALRPVPPSAPEGPAHDPGVLVEARDELDQIAGFNSISRLQDLADEARAKRHDPG